MRAEFAIGLRPVVCPAPGPHSVGAAGRCHVRKCALSPLRSCCSGLLTPGSIMCDFFALDVCALGGYWAPAHTLRKSASSHFVAVASPAPLASPVTLSCQSPKEERREKFCFNGACDGDRGRISPTLTRSRDTHVRCGELDPAHWIGVRCMNQPHTPTEKTTKLRTLPRCCLRHSRASRGLSFVCCLLRRGREGGWVSVHTHCCTLCGRSVSLCAGS